MNNLNNEYIIKGISYGNINLFVSKLKGFARGIELIIGICNLPDYVTDPKKHAYYNIKISNLYITNYYDIRTSDDVDFIVDIRYNFNYLSTFDYHYEENVTMNNIKFKDYYIFYGPKVTDLYETIKNNYILNVIL